MRGSLRLKRLLTRHWALTFLMMGFAALVFGLVSVNLFFFFKANLAFIAEHGALALTEGALVQLVELCFYGFLALAAYIFIKACEKVLVERLLR